MPDKYSAYHLHCPTNIALTNYSVRQIQHLPPTLPTNTALTNYSARQIQHLLPTLAYKYSTCHLHCQQIQHWLTTLPTYTAFTNYTANKYSTYHPITIALLVPSHLIIHLKCFHAYWWRLTLASGPEWVGFVPPPLLCHRCRHSQRPKRRVPRMSAFRQPTKHN